MKKAGISLLIPSRILCPQKAKSGLKKSMWRKTMTFDDKIVAYAKEFVNNLQANKPARVPAISFEHWQQFMTTVYASLADSQ